MGACAMGRIAETEGSASSVRASIGCTTLVPTRSKALSPAELIETPIEA
jgi:hypothetical protein